MTTSLDQLADFMATPSEHETLEFKEAKNQYDIRKLFRYCVALANEGGGKFILGVTDKPPRVVVGTTAFQDTNKIKSQILSKIGFRVSTEEIPHPDGRVLIFNVPPRPRGTAFQFEGAYWMRSGEETVPMTEDRLREIFSEGKPDWLEEMARYPVTESEIVQLLDTQSYFDLHGLPYPAERKGVLDRLISNRLIIDDGGGFGITNLCAILFSKRLSDFEDITRKAPRVVVYDGINKLNTRLDQDGTKGYAVGFEGLVEFISNQTPQNEIVEKTIRKEVKMFPEIAVRELVANALIHQDFEEHGTSVMVEIYSDRIEISNPGTPFIQPDRFIDEYQSRNERLAGIMRRIGICEEKGSGIDKVVNAAEIFQLPAPDFRSSDRRTIASLYGHKPFELMNRAERNRACYQHCVLRYVMNEKMSNQSLRDRFKLPENKNEVVSRIIRESSDLGQIKPENLERASKRYARYVPYWA